VRIGFLVNRDIEHRMHELGRTTNGNRILGTTAGPVPVPNRKSEEGVGIESEDASRIPVPNRRSEEGVGAESEEGSRIPVPNRKSEEGVGVESEEGSRIPVPNRKSEEGVGVESEEGSSIPVPNRRSEEGVGVESEEGSRIPVPNRRSEEGVGVESEEGSRIPVPNRKSEEGAGVESEEGSRIPVPNRKSEEGVGVESEEGSRIPVPKRKSEEGVGVESEDAGRNRYPFDRELAKGGWVRTVRVQAEVVIRRKEAWGEVRPVGQPAKRAMERTEAGVVSGLPAAKNVTPGWKVGGFSPSSPARLASAVLLATWMKPGGQPRPTKEERSSRAVLPTMKEPEGGLADGALICMRRVRPGSPLRAGMLGGMSGLALQLAHSFTTSAPTCPSSNKSRVRLTLRVNASADTLNINATSRTIVLFARVLCAARMRLLLRTGTQSPTQCHRMEWPIVCAGMQSPFFGMQ
jgi:hypothetical protein